MTTITNPITKRLLILWVVLLAGLGSFMVIPRRHGSQPVGIALSLPEDVGSWHGRDAPVSDKEKAVLGIGTEFARKYYTLPNGGGIFVSIVLSGHDVETSLHRPDRCLPAQGWAIMEQKRETLPLNNNTSIPVTRLLNQCTNEASSQHTPYSVYYYWFVGCNDVVASPFQRSMIDWRDRLFKGYDQRWAYITVAADVRDNSEQTQAAADAAIQSFVADLFPKIWKPADPKG
ncbi:MAG TPA: EpsI family protein [Chthoniobacteraceae bacterium]|nr:EpsI family protein [Chthoniobacteraceae bacterium]